MTHRSYFYNCSREYLNGIHSDLCEKIPNAIYFGKRESFLSKEA